MSFFFQYMCLTVQITIRYHEIKTHSFLLFLIKLLSQRSESSHLQTRELCSASKHIKRKEKEPFAFRLVRFEGRKTIRIFQGQQSPYHRITHTRARTLLYMFLLELMERIEHASDYLQQTNIHTQLKPYTLLFKLSIVQFIPSFL